MSDFASESSWELWGRGTDESKHGHVLITTKTGGWQRNFLGWWKCSICWLGVTVKQIYTFVKTHCTLEVYAFYCMYVLCRKPRWWLSWVHLTILSTFKNIFEHFITKSKRKRRKGKEKRERKTFTAVPGATYSKWRHGITGDWLRVTSVRSQQIADHLDWAGFCLIRAPVQYRRKPDGQRWPRH